MGALDEAVVDRLRSNSADAKVSTAEAKREPDDDSAADGVEQIAVRAMSERFFAAQAREWKRQHSFRGS